mgnify:CR=1
MAGIITLTWPTKRFIVKDDDVESCCQLPDDSIFLQELLIVFCIHQLGYLSFNEIMLLQPEIFTLSGTQVKSQVKFLT